ncbi:MAG: hypothetical protein PHG24_01175, partial [Candidatus Pacebacteria bacterium]|nr:hypothetical protein [Candidatus Paceibacterota bacterium]
MNFETFNPKVEGEGEKNESFDNPKVEGEKNELSEELERIEALMTEEEKSGKNLHNDDESHEYFKLKDKRDEILVKLSGNNPSIESSTVSSPESATNDSKIETKELEKNSFEMRSRADEFLKNRKVEGINKKFEEEREKVIKQANEDYEISLEKLTSEENVFLRPEEPWINGFSEEIKEEKKEVLEKIDSVEKESKAEVERLSPEKKSLFGKLKETLSKKETQKKIILISLAIGVSVAVPPVSIMMGGGLFGVGAGLSVPVFEALGLASYSPIIGGSLGTAIIFNAIEKGAGLFSKKGKGAKEISSKEFVKKVEEAASTISDGKESIFDKIKRGIFGETEDTSG